MTAGSFCSSYHLIVCRIRFSEPDVFTDTFIEQKIVLCNITDFTHQLCERNLFNILSAKITFPFVASQKPAMSFAIVDFPGTGRADNC